MKEYLIKILVENGEDYFIENIVLKGKHDKLLKKMKNINYVAKLNIDEKYYFENFELVEKIKESDI